MKCILFQACSVYERDNHSSCCIFLPLLLLLPHHNCSTNTRHLILDQEQEVCFNTFEYFNMQLVFIIQSQVVRGFYKSITNVLAANMIAI